MTNQEQLRIPGSGAGRRTAARAKSKGGRKKPDHPGTPAPDQGRQRSERALRLPHLCRTTITVTSHETTQPRTDPGRLHRLWRCGQPLFPAFCAGTPTWEPGEGGGRGHCTSSLPGKTNQGCWLGTPPHPEVKVRAVSACENSQAGCLERECTAPRRVECGGQQQVQGSQ